MKRILKQLKKIYPKSYIVVKQEFEVGLHTGDTSKITDTLRIYAYASDIKLGSDDNAWSDNCNSIGELDKYLANKIEGYNKVYNK